MFELSQKLVLSFALLLSAQLVQAHGYVEYPKARQQICKDDGGYWWPADGSGMPNAACRASYQQSGGYALTQYHEYSGNVADYHNLLAVKAVVKDGLLCAGGDSRKSGMDLPSAHWQTTTVDLAANRTLRLRFRATTPHNPSFWQFYLSNPDFNPATEALSWAKLTLLHQQNDVAVNAGYYEIDLPLPAARSGKAVLYTRWQRQDVVGEGFYNCSDLTFINGDSSTPDWQDKGAYLTAAQLGNTGETALLRVFNEQGQEQLQKSLPITVANQPNRQWARELAQQVNQLHSHLLQIGVKTGSSISVTEPLSQNRFWLRNSGWFVNLDLQAAPNDKPSCGGVDPAKIYPWPQWPRLDQAGRPSYASSGDYLSDQGRLFQAKWWTQSKPGSDSSWQFVCQLTGS